MINVTALLKFVELVLREEMKIDPTTPMTPEMGALVRDRGEQPALEAAALRRQLGEFHDLGRCSEFVVGPHRRRLR